MKHPPQQVVAPSPQGSGRPQSRPGAQPGEPMSFRPGRQRIEHIHRRLEYRLVIQGENGIPSGDESGNAVVLLDAVLETGGRPLSRKRLSFFAPGVCFRATELDAIQIGVEQRGGGHQQGHPQPGMTSGFMIS